LWVNDDSLLPSGDTDAASWSSGDTGESSMMDSSGVDSWGNTVFMRVDNTSRSSNPLDNGFSLNWGWDGYIVWSINMNGGWYFDDLFYVLDNFVWDIVWSLNWDWFVYNKRFLGDAGDWGIVGNSSSKGSWDGNVDVTNDWFKDSAVVCGNVWSGTIFDFLGYYWRGLMNRDSIWSSNVGGGIWSWDTDGGGSGDGNWCGSNWSSS
jgi:hypothetical protein